MAENLLRDTWANLDQADLKLLLEKRIGGPGQLDGGPDVHYLPLAREKGRVALRYKGPKLIAVEPAAAFDHSEWERICSEIETSFLKGQPKIGQEFSFSTFRVEGYWRGARSKVQILPPPADAPRAAVEMADHPFILEFPIQETSLWDVTNLRRRREHRKVTLLLNLLLVGTIKFLPDRRRHFWACIQTDTGQKFKWVYEFYDAKLGEIVTNELSPPTGGKLEEVEPDKYYKEVGHDGRGLRVPNDLDDLICRYQNLPSTLQAKFDRAAYWMSMAARQWEDSASASFTSLVSSVEALTETSTKHWLYCEECKRQRSHDVPGAIEKFRTFFDKYAPEPGLKERRTKMYTLRSAILHGSDLMQLDQSLAFGFNPPGWNEQEVNWELWALTRTAVRNWLKEQLQEAGTAA